MNDFKSIIDELKNGNKNVVKELVLTTRLHVLNTIRSIVKDDDLAVQIASDVYEELLLCPQDITNEKIFIEYLNSLIYEKTNKYIQEIDKLKLQKTKTDFNLEKINIEDYKEYYNNPKVEKIIYETINSLPKEEKAIIIDNYFFGKDTTSLANKYNTSVEVIQSYINKANELIDKKSKPLFIKNKIINADYNGVSVVYSTIKLGMSIMSFDILGIAVDKLEEQFQDDQSKKKNLDDFVEDVIKDYIKDWFLERIKSAIVTGITAATATNVATAKESKTAGISLVKKIVLGTTVTSVITVGSVIAYNTSQNTYDKKLESIQNDGAVYSYVSKEADMPVLIDVYCDKENPNEIKTILLEVDISEEELNSKKLGILETAAIAIGGVDIYHQDNEDDTTVRVVVEKDKINENLISTIESLNAIDQDVIEKAKSLLNCDADELATLMQEYGLTAK